MEFLTTELNTNCLNIDLVTDFGTDYGIKYQSIVYWLIYYQSDYWWIENWLKVNIN